MTAKLLAMVSAPSKPGMSQACSSLHGITWTCGVTCRTDVACRSPGRLWGEEPSKFWRSFSDSHKRCIRYHNDEADKFAKETKRASCPLRVRSLQQVVQKRIQCQRRQIEMVQAFHADMARRTAGSSITDNNNAGVVRTCGANSRMHLRVRISFMLPNQPSCILLGTWSMSAAFTKTLEEYMFLLRWVHDPGGFSLLECYVHFVACTEWHVPINIAAWKTPFQVQGGYSSNAAPAAPAVWVHETPHALLKMRRQTMTVQLRTFRHILQRLLLVANIDFPLISAPTLLDIGVRVPLLGLEYRPMRTLMDMSCENCKIQ